MIKKLILSFKGKLTIKEKEIAEYILENMSEILKMTSAELAKRAGVGQSSVIKFIKKIGFNKYGDFKIQLSKELENEKIYKIKETIHSQIYTDDSLEDIATKTDRKSVV